MLGNPYFRKLFSVAREIEILETKDVGILTEVPYLAQKWTCLGNWMTREGARVFFLKSSP